ncbi:MAG: hypothetical protein K2X64_09900, partial [Rhodocyclaceae bacterium]|nr:hypothetical protein [Rhodocyclaceae bacterium]
MSDVIGRGVIEVSADARKMSAGIDEAKKSLKGLGIAAGEATKSQSASIDRYIKGLGIAAVTTGKTARELELYKLGLRGATTAQLATADAALKLTERADKQAAAYERGIAIGNKLKTSLFAAGAAGAAGFIAASVIFNQLVKKAGDFQDLAEEIGSSAEAIASLSVPAATAGVAIDSVAAATIRLTKGLVGVDDESKATGAALAALGISIEDFKKLDPVAQYEAVGKALAGYADGAEKTAVAVALFGKSGAEQLKVFKALEEQGGRQVILTAEQIAQADNYVDKQAKSKAELLLYASAIATQALPAVTVFTNVIADLSREILNSAGESKALGKNTGVADFAKASAVFVAGLIDSLVGVRDSFVEVGNAIGATAAILATPVGPGMLDQIRGINKALSEDQAKLFKSNVQGRVIAGFANAEATRLGTDTTELARRGRAQTTRPTLKFSGATKSGGGGAAKNTAAEEAKAQLAFDIDEIRKAGESLSNTIANAEKISEAQRGANLISEADYYAEKRKNILANDEVQEQSVLKEIARLQAEGLTGKDKINNDRKIVDAQAKLTKQRENAAASLEVLGIQERNALDTISKGYADAREAAQSYLDTVNRGRAAELAGMGQGERARQFSQGIAQIEEKYAQQRQDLQRDNRNGKFAGRPDDYARELALIEDFQRRSITSYTQYFTDLQTIRAESTRGGLEALQNYADSANDIYSQTESLVTNSFKGIEDALVGFVSTGKLSFKGLADSIVADISRIIIKQQILGPIAAALGGSAGGAGGGGGDI